MFSMQVPSTEPRLCGLKLYELIDPNMLSAFKSTNLSDVEYTETKYATERITLCKYEELYKKKYNLFEVEYTRGRRKMGRVYPKDGLGMTSIRRITRNTFMRDTYYDIDMENAAPNIIMGLLKNKGVDKDFPTIAEYCVNRNDILRKVMTGYSCTRKQAKDAFISVMFGSSVSSWKKDVSQGDDPSIECFIDEYKIEIAKVIDMFIAENRELYYLHVDNYRKNPKNKDKKNERGSFLSLITQDYEIRIVDYLLSYIMDKTPLSKFNDKDVISYSYDGFMLLKSLVDANGGIHKLLEDIAQLTYDFCGIEINWTSKNMNDEYHSDFVYEPPESDEMRKEREKKEKEEKQKEKEEMKKQKKENEKREKEEKQKEKEEKQKEKEESKKTDTKKTRDDFDTAFKKMKDQFEKTNFKSMEISAFVEETYFENKRTLIQRKSSELKVAFSHLKIKYREFENGKPVDKVIPFIPVWIECEDIRKYEKMDCFPKMSMCPPSCFNIWSPFEMERYYSIPYTHIEDIIEREDVKEGVKFLRNHMSIMCDHQPDTLLEFEKWLAHMIQFPEHKSHMPIFQSDEGSGKGSFFALLRKILGEDKILETESPEEYVWGRFNNLMETSFLVVMNEISKQMTNGGMDKIKGIIDSPHIQIQHKGKGAYPMKSHHRFAGCTNAWDGGMTIKKGSRRFLMCKMSDEKKGNMEYWTKFRKYLENTEVLRGFYNYYKKMEVPSVLPPPMKTEFAKELEKLSVDVPTLWVRDLVADARVNKSLYLTERKMEYKIINNEYVIELTGKRACELLMQWCKETGFEKYETNPVKLGVFLKTKKWDGLIKGRATNYGDTRYYRVEKLMEELKEEDMH